MRKEPSNYRLERGVLRRWFCARQSLEIWAWRSNRAGA
jgi:hypothetical protein